MPSVEVLITGEERPIGLLTLDSAAAGASQIGFTVRTTKRYTGGSDWLCVYGAGEAKRNAARVAHLASGGHVACWDLGYFGRDHNWAEKNYVRVSLDKHHPQDYIGKTAPRPDRWAELGIKLREDADPQGHVVVIGMGRKSRSLLDLHDWERKAVASVLGRFPERRVLYRPKRGPEHIDCEQDWQSDIEDVLKGASLVVCRHSNCAIDACIAGVPCETEDGAAHWLYSRGSNPTQNERLDFLRRISWWQWRQPEMYLAWRFLAGVGI